MNKVVEQLIKQIKTDTSGKWVQTEDLKLLVELTIQEASKFTDHGEELYKHFGVTNEPRRTHTSRSYY